MTRESSPASSPTAASPTASPTAASPTASPPATPSLPSLASSPLLMSKYTTVRRARSYSASPLPSGSARYDLASFRTAGAFRTSAAAASLPGVAPTLGRASDKQPRRQPTQPRSQRPASPQQRSPAVHRPAGHLAPLPPPEQASQKATMGTTRAPVAGRRQKGGRPVGGLWEETGGREACGGPVGGRGEIVSGTWAHLDE
eukprot:CAMPEP_0181241574 /NCGR_PEP_ID=MMETSP1096-20121128/41202_1 /TAXON_ID=156174 ORGANISM="Chrysochromulina ericina, Strain CCMP281" /NCGR_SAMPLE_ID=MMETSP1096 /ASSEMBLY_ACC=CAM_ASM_000453 /LENGTH=199 /DNA_ID=CAMNT_0023337671 /DNA_START=283 /DNA_END=883 /DNA_ORIENTATION=+